MTGSRHFNTLFLLPLCWSLFAFLRFRFSTTSIFFFELWNQLCEIQLKSLHFSLHRRRHWHRHGRIEVEAISITFQHLSKYDKPAPTFSACLFCFWGPRGFRIRGNWKSCLWQPAYCILNCDDNGHKSGIRIQKQQAATIVLSVRPEGHFFVRTARSVWVFRVRVMFQWCPNDSPAMAELDPGAHLHTKGITMDILQSLVNWNYFQYYLLTKKKQYPLSTEIPYL